MTELLVDLQGLSKKYGAFTAVNNLDLRLEEGEVYGFLGPNGSGKSTTILMLLGLTEPSGGYARVCGFDPTRDPISVKKVVGYLPENVGFYNDLTGRENLLYTARLNQIKEKEAANRVEDLLKMVELGGAMDQLVGQYSRGMRQRLGLADVLIKDPKLVILDDPTLGLDPAGIQWLLGLIQEMSSKNKITIFLSSHQLHEVQRVCHRVGIMSEGNLVLEGTVEGLTGSDGAGNHRIEMVLKDKVKAVAQGLDAIPGVTQVDVKENRITILSSVDVRSAAVTTTVELRAGLVELVSSNRTLEDIYLRYFQVAS